MDTSKESNKTTTYKTKLGNAHHSDNIIITVIILIIISRS
jgi:hypothetical protein